MPDSRGSKTNFPKGPMRQNRVFWVSVFGIFVFRSAAGIIIVVLGRYLLYGYLEP